MTHCVTLFANVTLVRIFTRARLTVDFTAIGADNEFRLSWVTELECTVRAGGRLLRTCTICKEVVRKETFCASPRIVVMTTGAKLDFREATNVWNELLAKSALKLDEERKRTVTCSLIPVSSDSLLDIDAAPR